MHDGHAVLLSEQNLSLLADRLKDEKFIREGDRDISYQVSFPRIAETMTKASSAPKSLQKP